MFKYFDKNFFQFFLGFMALILLSFLTIIAARLYAARDSSLSVSTTQKK